MEIKGLLGGIMAGSFLGAVAGFLLAPKSGKELRWEIKERTNKAVNETKRFYADGCTKVRDTMACISGKRTSASHIESPEEIVADA